MFVRAENTVSHICRPATKVRGNRVTAPSPKFSKTCLVVKNKLQSFCRNYQLVAALHMQVWWIYPFALRLAVSYSLLYSVREVWFVSTCHLRQGNSCVRAPLRLRMTSIRIAFGFVHRRGHHALRESSCVSLAHGPRWLFLFLPFSVSVVLCLLVYRVFIACQFSRNYPRQFFRGGGILI